MTKERDLEQLLCDAIKETLLTLGFKLDARCLHFRRKISSKKTEAIYFVVTTEEASTFRVRLLPC